MNQSPLLTFLLAVCKPDESSSVGRWRRHPHFDANVLRLIMEATKLNMNWRHLHRAYDCVHTSALYGINPFFLAADLGVSGAIFTHGGRLVWQTHALAGSIAVHPVKPLFILFGGVNANLTLYHVDEECLALYQRSLGSRILDVQMHAQDRIFVHHEEEMIVYDLSGQLICSWPVPGVFRFRLHPLESVIFCVEQSQRFTIRNHEGRILSTFIDHPLISTYRFHIDPFRQVFLSNNAQCGIFQVYSFTGMWLQQVALPIWQHYQEPCVSHTLVYFNQENRSLHAIIGCIGATSSTDFFQCDFAPTRLLTLPS